MEGCEEGILQPQGPQSSIRIRTANIIWRKLLVYIMLAWSDSPEALSIPKIGFPDPDKSKGAGL